MAKRRKVAYVIKDVAFGEFKVYKSANAWWMDKHKLEQLISAFKHRHMVVTACAYAGITRHQYEYFVEQHPEFLRVKEASEQLLFIRAINTIVGNLDDPCTAKWFMIKHHPDYNPRLKREEEEEPHTCPQVDTSKLERIIGDVADEYLRRERPDDAYKVVNNKRMADRVFQEATNSGIQDEPMVPLRPVR